MMNKLFLSSAVLLCFIIFFCTPVRSEEQKPGMIQIDEKILAKPDIYKIGNGDVLEIFTWKEPEFTREVSVRNDGNISFPLLDDIHAAGRTPAELKNIIQNKLKDYILEPMVTVSLKIPNSQQFYVLGEVNKSGTFLLDKKLRVLQVFALTGGFTQWASTKDIILIRYEDDREKIIRINYKSIINGKDLSQNVLIKPDDTIIVP